jgi:hypothetical protein
MYRRCRSFSIPLVAVLVVATFLVGPPAHADVPVGSFTAGGSINQVYVYGLEPGASLRLLSPKGDEVGLGLADGQGSYLFKDVPKGVGYQVEADHERSRSLSVTDPTDHPDPSFYENAPDIPLEPTAGDAGGGYGYLTTRDGTTLSINVAFPTDDAGPGPWPVVVNYSGYEPSDPHSIPSETYPFWLNGYVVVGVNVRGSGCSGGAFDFFEPPQWTDGYDVVETLANQSWSNGNIGMVGISYGGLSQIYTAATQPPHLRAITPLSPYGDAYRSVIYPGGMLNSASPWPSPPSGPTTTSLLARSGSKIVSNWPTIRNAPRTSCCGSRTATSSPPSGPIRSSTRSCRGST